MYTEEQLSQYTYFREIFKTESMSDVLDPLTGLVCRAHIIPFAKSLIDEKLPFTFAMLDLDNFKFINDTYGHGVGDGVLKCVAEDIIDSLGLEGVGGRFGGDEFLFVHTGIHTYEEKKDFCRKLYEDGGIFRREIIVDGNELVITGTTGLASFPEDATDYDELFSMIDKTLYRGKTKGRNCYIIYVEAKHRDIEIKKLKKHGLYETFRGMSEKFDASPTAYGKLRGIYDVLSGDLLITDLYYVSAKGELKSVNDNRPIGMVDDIGKLVTDEVYATNRVDGIKDISPRLYAVLKSREIETFLVSRIGMGPMTFGYIMCAEPRNLRIWQEDAYAIMFSLSRMMAGFLRGSGQVLE